MKNLIEKSIKQVVANQKCLRQRSIIAGLLHFKHVQHFSYNQNEDNAENDLHFERVTSYETLISRISGSNSIENVLQTFQTNQDLYKNEHLVLTLRMLARLIKRSSQDELELLPQDQRYQQLVTQLEIQINLINEYEILDVLFWMRKFKMRQIDVLLNQQTIDEIFNKVDQFIKTSSFNFRNLVNLYYDFSFINRHSEEIVNEILKEIKQDVKLLTPFTTVQILQACSQKLQRPSQKEYALAIYIQNNLTNLLEEFDVDQKCVVLKYLAKLELQLNGTRGNIHRVLFDIKIELSEKLDQLSEFAVINVLHAYEYLPIQFPNDLLDEIKEMVVVTIQQNSGNIKSFFLLDFVDCISKLKKKRKLQESQIQILFDELAKRLPQDAYLNRNKSIEKIINAMKLQGSQNTALNQALYTFCENKTSKQERFFNSNVFDYLAKNEVNINSIITELLEPQNIKSMSLISQLRLYILTDFCNIESPILKNKINEMIQHNPSQVIQGCKQSILVTSKKDILFEAIKSLADQYKSKTVDNIFFKSVLTSIEKSEHRLFWVNYFQNSPDLIDNRLTDALFNQQASINNEKILFMLQCVQYKGDIPIKKIISQIRDNKHFLQVLEGNESLNKTLFSILATSISSSSNDLQLQFTYNLLNRLEQTTINEQNYLYFMSKAGQNYLQESSKKHNIDYNGTIKLATFLMNHNELSLDDAYTILEKCPKSLQNVITKQSLINYILQKQSNNPSDELLKISEQNIEELNNGLQSGNIKQGLTCLCTVLGLPPQLFKIHQDFYLKSLKDFLVHTNAQSYLKILYALPSNSRMEQYYPFVKELINNYQKFNQKLQLKDVLKVLDKFSQINCKNPTIYNQILGGIGRYFNVLKINDMVQILLNFSRIGIRQPDLYDKLILKISDSNFQKSFSNYYTKLIRGLFRVGYDSATVKQSILQLMEKQLHFHEKQGNNNIQALKYLALLNSADHQYLFEKIINNLTEKVERSKIPSDENYRSLVMIYHFLRLSCRNQPELAEKIKVLIGDQYEKYNQEIFQQKQNDIQSVTLYLEAMHVEYALQQTIEEIPIEIIIPQKKKILKIVKHFDLNFDKTTFRGQFMLHGKILENLQNYQVIYINLPQLNHQKDHMSKINFLTLLGIENNNLTGNYDFSKIDNLVTKQEEDVDNDEDLNLNDEEEILIEEK